MDLSNFLRIAVHIGGVLPALLLLIGFFSGNLTANPIQALQQRTGITALNFLILSLACTPLSTITGYKKFTSRKKALGVYGFFYALAHLLIFIGLDYGFDFRQIFRDVGTKQYILFGLTAFLLLLPLAITSFKIMKKKLGPRWKKLHRAVYIISPIVVVHFLLSLKGNISQLQGDIIQPILYAVIIVILLILRIPRVKSLVARKV